MNTEDMIQRAAEEAKKQGWTWNYQNQSSRIRAVDTAGENCGCPVEVAAGKTPGLVRLAAFELEISPTRLANITAAADFRVSLSDEQRAIRLLMLEAFGLKEA
jgi:hypothetical protein